MPVGAEDRDLVDLAGDKAQRDGTDTEIIRGRGRRRQWGGVGRRTGGRASGYPGDVPGSVKAATFRDTRITWATVDTDLARQLLVNPAEVEDQNAIDEDEEIVVTVETETDASGAIVDEIVARLVGEVGVMLHPRSCRDPAAIAQRDLVRAIRLEHTRREEILVAGAGSPNRSSIAMVPVGP